MKGGEGDKQGDEKAGVAESVKVGLMWDHV